MPKTNNPSNETLKRLHKLVRTVQDPLIKIDPMDDPAFEDEITSETSLDDLGLDDLDFACFVMDAEKEFDVELTDEVILDILSKNPTVGALMKKIEEARSNASA